MHDRSPSAAQRMPENINFTAQTVFFFHSMLQKNPGTARSWADLCLKTCCQKLQVGFELSGLFLEEGSLCPCARAVREVETLPKPLSFSREATVSKHLSWIQASCIRFTFLVCFENWRLHWYMKFKNEACVVIYLAEKWVMQSLTALPLMSRYRDMN